MIIMLNGPFGVGKTSAAELLCDKLSGAMIYDPEEVGFMLRNIVTEEVMDDDERTGDFQDLRPWSFLVVEVARVLRRTYGRDLIVPMTIAEPQRLEYIRRGFREIDGEVHHFCLTADRETVWQRLISRGDEPGSWAFQQTDRCLDAFGKAPEIFEQVIRTDGFSAVQVCGCILRHIEQGTTN